MAIFIREVKGASPAMGLTGEKIISRTLGVAVI